MRKRNNLSNSFSTGGGGVHFEAHIQASFVVLMLTGGQAPCLPSWPIVEIRLQGKIDGFDTDDLIVVVENQKDKERRKLLGQVKHSIAITLSCTKFGEVIQAAWNDFNNPNLFNKGKDVIALITGPLSATDSHNVQWLLNQAKHTRSADEFLRNVQQSNFSPSDSEKKLKVIQHYLKVANGGSDVTSEELYEFLNHFYLLGYDLGSEFGVVLSLLYSHISLFQQDNPEWLWSRFVDIVQAWNQDAGTITHSNLPDDLLAPFKKSAVAEMPKEFKASLEKPKTDWTHHPNATDLAMAILIGSWRDNSQSELESITHHLRINYDEWQKKMRGLLHCPDSPLSFKNDIWKVVNRVELWNQLASRIYNQDLDKFRLLAVSVLREPDPAFELPSDKRYAASILGKVLKHSHYLRKGIAEGLAILGSNPESCVNCSPGNSQETSKYVIRELLTDADHVLWASLNILLPILAEAAPDEFLNAVDNAMGQKPCPFDALFYQEGNGMTGSNYLTGLLWALEGLAWDEQYLVRACVTLAELASHDPGGQWKNRPSNSLANILLPWFPQTLASASKCQVAVQTIFQQFPDIAWDLIIQLLPGQHQTSSGSHKPSWRKIIPDDWKHGMTHQEFWQQASFYSELAVDSVGQDTTRLSVLIDHFQHLHKNAFDKLLQIITSQWISDLPNEKRLLIWNHLTKLTKAHRRFTGAEWAMPDELITRIEDVAYKLAPNNPFEYNQYLFTDRDEDHYEGKGDWEEQRKKLDSLRENAMFEIFQQYGTEGVIQFAESVSSPGQVGYSLGIIDESVIEYTLLPSFLDSSDNKHRALVSGYIWRRYHIKGWEWCDDLDRSDWTPEQAGQFLTFLPFTKETWNRASKWLQAEEHQYWIRTGANVYQADGDLTVAIDKLIDHGRSLAAINCINSMRLANQPVNSNQCVRALLAPLSSNEPKFAGDFDNIVGLIKLLQRDSSVNQDDLFKVEWTYLPLLDGIRGVMPQFLESRLAVDPEFFCEIIRIIYRSKDDHQSARKSTKDSQTTATNAWRLLHNWKTPPGTQQDGVFSAEHFTEWLKRVKEVCSISGHLDVAFISIGEVLIHTPPDPDGLWINRAVAAALNDRDADGMRDGFRTGIYNSRGVYSVDPTGKVERELANQLRIKAEEIENAMNQRFAVTLRGLADQYDREAERIIAAHTKEGK